MVGTGFIELFFLLYIACDIFFLFVKELLVSCDYWWITLWDTVKLIVILLLMDNIREIALYGSKKNNNSLAD